VSISDLTYGDGRSIVDRVGSMFPNISSERQGLSRLEIVSGVAQPVEFSLALSVDAAV